MVSGFRWLAATSVAVAVAASTVAASVTAVAAATGTAQAAPAPGWRIAAVYPEDSGVAAIAAASADNAWAEENCTRPCHTGSGGYSNVAATSTGSARGTQPDNSKKHQHRLPRQHLMIVAAGGSHDGNQIALNL